MMRLSTLAAFLLVVSFTNAAIYHYVGNTTNQAIPDCCGHHLTTQLHVEDVVSWSGSVEVVLELNILHNNAQDLRVSLTHPDGTYTVLTKGHVNSDVLECTAKDFVNAKFFRRAPLHQENILWKCDTSRPLYSGFIRPFEDPEFGRLDLLPPATTEGYYTLQIVDNIDNGISGTLVDWSLTFTNDADNDSVKNADDNCPAKYNPGQEDSDVNGEGDACQCDLHNFNVDNNKRRVCFQLDNWALDERYYKGVRKNPGDWAEGVVVANTYDDFQPGSNTYDEKWLDCKCNTFPILGQLPPGF